MSSMRVNRLSWEDDNMLVALAVSQRSPDPSTQVGAYLVDEDNRPLGTGYNGVPKGIIPSSIPWVREADSLEKTKYPWVIHAERNAIFNATNSIAGATLYVTLHPCHDCAKDIIQAGIKHVVYLDNKYKNLWSTKLATKMLEQVDIETQQHTWDQDRMSICLQNLQKAITLQNITSKKL